MATTRTSPATQQGADLITALQENTQAQKQALARLAELARMIEELKGAWQGTPAPTPAPTPTPTPRTRPAEPTAQRRDDGPIPRSGRHLFAWGRERNLIAAIIEIGEGRDFAGRIVEWTPEEVRTAHADLMDLLEQDQADAPEHQPAAY